jgi:hypothetical protein
MLIVTHQNTIKKQSKYSHDNTPIIPMKFAVRKNPFNTLRDLSRLMIPIPNQHIDPKIKNIYPQI